MALAAEAAMRPFLITLLSFAAIVAGLTARDSVDRQPIRSADPDRRERLKQYLAAFQKLSPETQDHIRRLDKELRDENPATRARLIGIMEKYAQWLSALSDTDRKLIEKTPASSERLRVIREIMERQWLDNLPTPRKELLAKATDTAERANLIERWHREERDRNQDRVWQLRDAQESMIPGQAERFKRFREAVEHFAKTELEPKLAPKEKSHLQTAAEKMRLQPLAGRPATFAYLHLVWVLSAAHGMTPPGTSDMWERYREPRRP
jgi:hypothetical protein